MNLGSNNWTGGEARGSAEVHLHQCTQHGQQKIRVEAIVWQASYDLAAIMETWWDYSHDWSAAMDGYKLFRRNRQGRRGGGVALYVKECFEVTELMIGYN